MERDSAIIDAYMSLMKSDSTYETADDIFSSERKQYLNSEWEKYRTGVEKAWNNFVENWKDEIAAGMNILEMLQSLKDAEVGGMKR